MVYKFKTAKFAGLDAQKVGEELERIRVREGGKLNTNTVWQEARLETSPMHKAFTWDLEKAAERCWKMEASTLIRQVVVSIDEVERPAFINVSVQKSGEDDEGVDRYYQSISVIASRPDEYESALAASRARLFSAQTSLDDLYAIAKAPKKAAVQRAQKHLRSAVHELAV